MNELQDLQTINERELTIKAKIGIKKTINKHLKKLIKAIKKMDEERIHFYINAIQHKTTQYIELKKFITIKNW